MFTHATSASATLATTTSRAQSSVPSSPGRPSRLRGLSYLRNYTHALHSGHSRDISSPSGNSTPTPTTTTPQNEGQIAAPPPPAQAPAQAQMAAPAAQRRQSLGRTTSYPPTPGRGASIPRTPTENAQLYNLQSSMAATATAVREVVAQPERTPWPELPVSPLVVNGDGWTNSVPPSVASAPQGETGSDTPLTNANTNTTLTVVNNPSPPPPTDFRPTIRFSQHQDPRAPRPSLIFTPMGRTLPTGTEIIKVGRYSERETAPNQPANLSTAAPVGFKSKVVSRRHCEFWVENGQWYIRDVKSSSGTFLNHVRLSPPNTESKPFPVKDGDIVQLGIDFKGGEEMIFRCVKIRVEVNRGWQAGLNSFNVSSHRMLKRMTKGGGGGEGGSSSDCSICLSAVAPCQALFVAPCSHTWHYKCIRPVLDGPHFPHFTCPNCRAVADLDADVDEPTEGEWEELDLALEQSQAVASAANLLSGANGASVAAAEPGPAPTPTQTQTPAAAPAADEESAQPSTVTAPATTSSTSSSSATQPTPATEPRRNTTRTPIAPAYHGTYANAPAPVAMLTRRERERDSVVATEAAASIATAMPIAIVGRRERGSEEERGGNGLVMDQVENPMTPRNDAGPFVFDGRAETGGEEGGNGNGSASEENGNSEAGW